MTAQEKPAPPSGEQLPEAKQTDLGLYVTAREAYIMWRADPENVKILDVRTPEEYIFIGHPDMAVNIPLLFPKYEWDEQKRRYGVEPYADFLADVRAHFTANDTILAMCRCGGRSAAAVNMLAKAGFAKVYTITDGMEGDKVKEPGSLFHGKRMKNGWKNAGLPWTYDLDSELIWHPHEDKLEEVKAALDL
jgi:rhodanese-related sulfurtransferase